MDKKSSKRLIVVSCFFLVSVLLFIISMSISDGTFTPFSTVSFILFLLSFVVIIAFCIWVRLSANAKSNVIIADYGQENTKEKTYNVGFVNVSMHGFLKNTTITSLEFNKSHIKILAGNIFVDWKEVQQVIFKNRSIYIKLKEFEQISSAGDFCGIVFPLKQNLFYLIKTFYSGELVGEDYANSFFQGSTKQKANVLFTHSNAVKSIVTISLVSLAVVCVGVGIGLALTFGASIEQSIATCVAVPCVVVPQITILQRFKFSNWARLTLTEQGVEIVSRENNASSISFKTRNSIEWGQVKLIRYNDKHIKFEGSPSIVYVNSPKIFAEVKRVVQLKSPDCKWELTNEVLSYAKLPKNTLKKSLFFDLAFENIYYLNGVNVFDYLLKPENKTEKANSVLINIYKGDKCRLQRCEVSYYKFTGSTVEIELGIAEIASNVYALFFGGKQDMHSVVGITSNRREEFVKILEQDYEKNIQHKIDLVLERSAQEETERASKNNDSRNYIYSDNIQHLRRCYILKEEIIKEEIIKEEIIKEEVEGEEVLKSEEIIKAEEVEEAEAVLKSEETIKAEAMDAGQAGVKYTVYLDALNLLGYAEEQFVIEDLYLWVSAGALESFNTEEQAVAFAKEAVQRILIPSEELIAELEEGGKDISEEGKRKLFATLLQEAGFKTNEIVYTELYTKLQSSNVDAKVAISNALNLDLYDATQYQVVLDLEMLINKYVKIPQQA